MTAWPAPFARSRVVGARAPTPGLERADVLTPYALELIAEDTRAAGPGARLVVEIAEPATRGDVTWLRDRLLSTVARGTEVAVRRGRPAPHAGPRPG
jgi:hypothetical protein